MHYYLTEREYRNIKNAWYNNDYSMNNVLFDHYNKKRDELIRMKKLNLISPIKFHFSMKYAKYIFIKSTEYMNQLKTIRIEYFDSAITKIDEYVMKLDSIGYSRRLMERKTNE